jgi:hypothetical protein
MDSITRGTQAPDAHSWARHTAAPDARSWAGRSAGRLVAVVAIALVCAGCGGQSESSSAAVTSLPLQTRALAIGGDTMAAGVDVASVSITPEQAKEIAKKCRGTIEIADTLSGSTEQCVAALLPLIVGKPCAASRLCLHVSDLSNVAGVAYDGVIQISGPASTLCQTSSDGVCLRLGVTTQTLMSRFASVASPTDSTTTSSGPPTSTTPSPTDTTTAPSLTPSPSLSP